MKDEFANHISPAGELLRRMESGMRRLEEKEYAVSYVRSMDQSGWAGDYRGRALLGMTHYSRLLGRPCSNMQALAEDTLDYLHTAEMTGEEEINEQSIAGNSWLLRALLAYGEYAADPRFTSAAGDLFENCYLRASERFSGYPLRKSNMENGGPIGKVATASFNGWKLSTDVGCAFIALDGISDYYARACDPSAKLVFTRLLDPFLRADPSEMSMQTHATLSCLRGCLRMYEKTGDTDLLALVKERYQLYLDTAMTLNYANYNWFGRPQWTECCGIVDAYLLAIGLFRNGCGENYVEIANKILYNALMAGQRVNGGFGSDCCIVPNGSVQILEPHPECYEAFWCCTMRGAEGLTRSVCDAVCRDKNDLYVLIWNAGTYGFGSARVTVSGELADNGTACVRLEGADAFHRLFLYRPAHSCLYVSGDGIEKAYRQGVFCEIKVRSDMEISVRFELPPYTENVGSRKTHWRGPMMLAEEGKPLTDRFYMPKEALMRGLRVVSER